MSAAGLFKSDALVEPTLDVSIGEGSKKGAVEEEAAAGFADELEAAVVATVASDTETSPTVVAPPEKTPPADTSEAAPESATTAKALSSAVDRMLSQPTPQEGHSPNVHHRTSPTELSQSLPAAGVETAPGGAPGGEPAAGVGPNAGSDYGALALKLEASGGVSTSNNEGESPRSLTSSGSGLAGSAATVVPSDATSIHAAASGAVVSSATGPTLGEGDAPHASDEHPVARAQRDVLPTVSDTSSRASTADGRATATMRFDGGDAVKPSATFEARNAPAQAQAQTQTQTQTQTRVPELAPEPAHRLEGPPASTSPSPTSASASSNGEKAIPPAQALRIVEDTLRGLGIHVTVTKSSEAGTRSMAPTTSEVPRPVAMAPDAPARPTAPASSDATPQTSTARPSPSVPATPVPLAPSGGVASEGPMPPAGVATDTTAKTSPPGQDTLASSTAKASEAVAADPLTRTSQNSRDRFDPKTMRNNAKRRGNTVDEPRAAEQSPTSRANRGRGASDAELPASAATGRGAQSGRAVATDAAPSPPSSSSVPTSFEGPVAETGGKSAAGVELPAPRAREVRAAGAAPELESGPRPARSGAGNQVVLRLSSSQDGPHALDGVRALVRVQGSQVHARLLSENAEMELRLRESLPELRQMLAQRGLDPTSVDIVSPTDPDASGGHSRRGQDPRDRSERQPNEQESVEEFQLPEPEELDEERSS